MTTPPKSIRVWVDLDPRCARKLHELATAQTGGDVPEMARRIFKKTLTPEELGLEFHAARHCKEGET